MIQVCNAAWLCIGVFLFGVTDGVTDSVLVEGLIKTAQTHLEDGLPQKALSVLNQALAHTQEKPELQVQALSIYPLKAVCLEELDATEKAILVLERALLSLSPKTDPKHLYLEEISTQLAWIYHESSLFSQAKSLLQSSVEKLKKLSDTASLKIQHQLLLTLGELHEESDQNQAALKIYERAFSIEKALFLQEKATEFSAHTQWTLLLEVLDELGLAQEKFEELLDLIEAKEGSQSLKLSEALEKAADRYLAWSKPRDAGLLYYRALSIQEKHPPGSTRILELLQKSLTAKLAAKDYDHALSDAQKLLDRLKAAKEFNPKGFTSLVLTIIKIYAEKKSLIEAESTLNSALVTLASAESMASQNYLRLRFHLGIILSKQGHSKKAQFILESIWPQIKNKIKQEPDSLILLASHAHRMGLYIRAMRYLETCRDVLEASESDEILHIDPLILMSSVFKKIHRPKEARSRLEEAFNILRKNQREFDPGEIISHLKQFILSFEGLKQLTLKSEAESWLARASAE